MLQGTKNLGILKKEEDKIKRMQGKISQLCESWMSDRMGRGMNYKNLCVHWCFHQGLEILVTEAENNMSTSKENDLYLVIVLKL